ncbi:HMA2 domain-containing protein [Phormidesmis priestleyi]
MSSLTFTQSLSDKAIATVPYGVVHQTKGRIRLRVPQLSQDPVYATRLEQFIKSYSFVTEVSLNSEARSLAVCYQSNQISSREIQEQIAIALHQATLPSLSPHTTSALAKRLGVASQALTWHRSQTDFAQWSRDRDPEAISWQYDAASKTFFTVGDCSTLTAQTTSKGQRILQTLGGVTTAKVGCMVGKLAGEVIGLGLLGSAGVVIGAEVGAFVGEIVGEVVGSELGSFS